MEAQHAFDTHGRTPWALGLGVYRLDRRYQFRPWNNLVHLVEKLLPAGGLAILFKRDFGKRLLLHGARLQFSAALPLAQHAKRINQTFPRKRVRSSHRQAKYYAHDLRPQKRMRGRHSPDPDKLRFGFLTRITYRLGYHLHVGY